MSDWIAKLFLMTHIHLRWAWRRRIELAELLSEPWVLPSPESLLGSMVMESFRASGLDYRDRRPLQGAHKSAGERALHFDLFFSLKCQAPGFESPTC